MICANESIRMERLSIQSNARRNGRESQISFFVEINKAFRVYLSSINLGLYIEFNKIAKEFLLKKGKNFKNILKTLSNQGELSNLPDNSPNGKEPSSPSKIEQMIRHMVKNRIAKKSKPQPKQQAKNFQDIILQRRETFMDNIEAQEDKAGNKTVKLRIPTLHRAKTKNMKSSQNHSNLKRSFTIVKEPVNIIEKPKFACIYDTVLKNSSESPNRKIKNKTFTKTSIPNEMILEIDSMFQIPTIDEKEDTSKELSQGDTFMSTNRKKFVKRNKQTDNSFCIKNTNIFQQEIASVRKPIRLDKNNNTQISENTKENLRIKGMRFLNNQTLIKSKEVDMISNYRQRLNTCDLTFRSKSSIKNHSQSVRIQDSSCKVSVNAWQPQFNAKRIYTDYKRNRSSNEKLKKKRYFAASCSTSPKNSINGNLNDLQICILPSMRLSQASPCASSFRFRPNESFTNNLTKHLRKREKNSTPKDLIKFSAQFI